ncbi:MAG: transposase [Gemmatimonadota bacterium]|nr:transposase [Gemmatimonadota bacterium]
MDDRSLYATILGLEAPWEVERGELRETEQVVHVWVTAQEGTRFVCPACGEAGAIYDHGERSWCHLDTCQFQTLLHAAVPRISCPTHGVRTITVPRAERRSHFTLLFERLAIAWLKEATPLAVARRLGLTWEEANGIVERAVRRGPARRTSVAGRRLGIDEHSYLKHFQFVTMVVDLDTQHVLHVAHDRTAETLGHYFAGLSVEERAGITAIAMGVEGGVQHIWDYRSIPAARAFFWRWEAWARRSRLRPMVHLAGVVRRHLENILTSLAHRITNAVTEGLNAKIQWIKYSSRGFRDRERFKLAIYFPCGGLDLDPRRTAS